MGLNSAFERGRRIQQKLQQIEEDKKMAILGGLYGGAEQKAEAASTRCLTSLEIDKAANGYIIRSGGQIYIARNAEEIQEQIVAILVAAKIK